MAPSSVTVAPDGSLWFGGHGGAARFDGVEWQTIGAGPDSLINDTVNDIYIAADGTVYFATGGGVTRLTP